MTRLLIIQRPETRRDLVEIAIALAAGGASLPDRFLAATERAFQQLARRPGIGELQHFENPAFADLRCFRVPRFKNHLIFYRPIEGGIEVVRVLHAARDIQGLFEDQGGPA